MTQHFSYSCSALHGAHLIAESLDMAKAYVEMDMRGHERRPSTSTEWRWSVDYWIYAILRQDGTLREYATLRPVTDASYNAWIEQVGKEPFTIDVRSHSELEVWLSDRSVLDEDLLSALEARELWVQGVAEE